MKYVSSNHLNENLKKFADFIMSQDTLYKCLELVEKEKSKLPIPLKCKISIWKECQDKALLMAVDHDGKYTLKQVMLICTSNGLEIWHNGNYCPMHGEEIFFDSPSEAVTFCKENKKKYVWILKTCWVDTEGKPRMDHMVYESEKLCRAAAESTDFYAINMDMKDVKTFVVKAEYHK